MTDYKAVAASLRACTEPQKRHAADVIDELVRLAAGWRDQHAEELAAANAEVARLNKWADSMTDGMLKERQTAEAYQAELRAEVTRLKRALLAVRVRVENELGTLITLDMIDTALRNEAGARVEQSHQEPK